jgi:mannose-6-phosphate isomerase-like protein (cupin superfamily)
MQVQNARAHVVRLEELPWIEPPQHNSGFSKMLVNPDNTATRQFDFRVSVYRPKGHVEAHKHDIIEQVYYFLSGRGLLTLDGEPRIIEPNTAVFIPPGVVHAIENTGLEDLVFIVVSSPPQELSRLDK